MLSIGSLSPDGDPYECGELDEITPGEGGPGPAQQCQDFVVTDCPGPPIGVTIRVTLNTGADGTVLFFSPGTGQGYWASDKAPGFPETTHLLQRDLS